MDLKEIITGLNAKIAEAQNTIEESKKVISEAKNQIRKLQTLSKKAEDVLKSNESKFIDVKGDSPERKG